MAVINYDTIDGRIRSESTGGTRTGYLPDALGSVTATVQAGAVVNTYRYKPYGGQLSRTGGGDDPNFQWVGQWGYKPTGEASYYVRKRTYISTTSSWIQADLFWPSEQAYTYADGNPTILIDPFGLTSCDTCCCCPASIDMAFGRYYKNETRKAPPEAGSGEVKGFAGVDFHFLFKWTPSTNGQIGSPMSPCELSWKEKRTGGIMVRGKFEKDWVDLPSETFQWRIWNSPPCSERNICQAGGCKVYDSPGISGAGDWIIPESRERRKAGKPHVRHFDVCIRLKLSSGCAELSDCTMGAIEKTYKLSMTIRSDLNSYRGFPFWYDSYQISFAESHNCEPYPELWSSQ